MISVEDRKVGRIPEVNNPGLNKCNLHEIKGRDAFKLYSAGGEGKFSDRAVMHFNYQFPLEMVPNITLCFSTFLKCGSAKTGRSMIFA